MYQVRERVASEIINCGRWGRSVVPIRPLTWARAVERGGWRTTPLADDQAVGGSLDSE
jgi:hypothetical protein